MDRPAHSRILLIHGDPGVHEDFRRWLCAPQEAGGLPPSESDPVALLPSPLEIDAASHGPEGLCRVQEAVKRQQPYGMAAIDAGLGGEWDCAQTLRRIWRQDAELPVLLCLPSARGEETGTGTSPPREPAGECGLGSEPVPVSSFDCRELLARLARPDRCLLVAMPADPIELRQLVAAQLDRRRARLERAEELQSLRRTLAQTREEVAEANRAKGEFLANVSHEVRTPMNAILGFSRLLMKEPLRPDQAEKVRYVHEAANALWGMVNNVLDFSRLAAGQVKLLRAAFDVRETLRVVCDVARPAARAKGLSLHYRVVESVPRWLEGDELRFRQIVQNLIDNAVKFTEKGAVDVLVTLDEEGPRNAALRVMVTDTGVGIPPDRQAVIFDSFSQADGSTTRKFGGLGLGLAICKQLVDLMGGQIGFRSTPGEGSSFWIGVTLRKSEGRPLAPRADAAEIDRLPPGEDGCPAEPLPGGRPRVLVAEKEQLTRTLIEMLLGRVGCVVDPAASAREVRLVRGQAHYDLMLIDADLPDGDGLGLIEDLRRAEAGGPRQSPIVALLAHPTPERRERALRVGADEYLAKPFTPEMLIGTVQQYLPCCLDPWDTATVARASLSGARSHGPHLLEEYLKALDRALQEGNFSDLENSAGAVKDIALEAGVRPVADQAMRVQLAARGADSIAAAAAMRRLETALQEQPALFAEPLPVSAARP